LSRRVGAASQSRESHQCVAVDATGATAAARFTFAEMRSSGVRGLLIYCSDYKCSHSTTISGDRWPGHVRLFRSGIAVRLQGLAAREGITPLPQPGNRAARQPGNSIGSSKRADQGISGTAESFSPCTTRQPTLPISQRKRLRRRNGTPGRLGLHIRMSAIFQPSSPRAALKAPSVPSLDTVCGPAERNPNRAR
jgi:hypothetical protein